MHCLLAMELEEVQSSLTKSSVLVLKTPCLTARALGLAFTAARLIIALMLVPSVALAVS